MVMVSKDNEKVEAEVWGHVIKEGSMADSSTESHPIREEIGSVRLSCRNNATSGRFHSSNQFRAESISGTGWHMHQASVKKYPLIYMGI